MTKTTLELWKYGNRKLMIYRSNRKKYAKT